MPISYAGVVLPTFGPSENARAEAALSPSEIYDFVTPQWPGHGRTHLPFPAQVPLPPVWLGRWFWPWGASRWSRAHFLCDDAALARIRSASPSTSPKPLTLSDGNGGLVSADMWLLPPRPLYQCGLAGLWLLTFVDDRYYWWQKAADIIVTAGTTTWQQLLAAVAAALGIALTQTPVPAAYLLPPDSLTSHYEWLPPLLDAVCACVGLRLVRRLDGTCAAVSAAQAKAAQDAQLLAFAAPVTKMGGGTLDLAAPDDLNLLVPSSVTVAYPTPAGGVSPVNAPLGSLALPEFAGVGGYGRTQLFHDTATATAGNAAELLTLSRQIAADYYRWRLGRAEVRYAGIRPWVPGALEEVEWSHHAAGHVHTTVRRGPWNAEPLQLLHLGSAGAGPGGPGNPISYPLAQVTYGGVLLPPITQEHVEFFRANFKPEDYAEFEQPLTAGVWRQQIHTRDHVPLPSFRLGSLYWPQGASRYALGHWIATDAEMALIRPLAYAGNTLVPLDLVMTDAVTGVPVRAKELFMLPPRPLVQPTPGGSGETTWLLSLVDERYFWRTVPPQPPLLVPEGNTGLAWPDLFNVFNSTLGRVIALDALAPQYATFRAPPTFTTFYRSLAEAVDLACASIGHRFVRRPDGTCRTESAPTARALMDAQALQTTPRACGGRFLFDGTQQTHDLNALVPRYLSVIMSHGDPNGLPLRPRAYQFSLDGEPGTTGLAATNVANVINPAAPLLAGVNGRPECKVLHTTAYEVGTELAGAATSPRLLAYQLVNDYYAWQLGRVDVHYRGVVAWVPCGYDDVVEWRVLAGDVSTHVLRAPWNAGPEHLAHYHAGNTLPAPGGAGPALLQEAVAATQPVAVMNLLSVGAQVVTILGGGAAVIIEPHSDLSYEGQTSAVVLSSGTDRGGWFPPVAFGDQLFLSTTKAGPYLQDAADNVLTPNGTDCWFGDNAGGGWLYDSKEGVWRPLFRSLDFQGDGGEYDGPYKVKFERFPDDPSNLMRPITVQGVGGVCTVKFAATFEALTHVKTFVTEVHAALTTEVISYLADVSVSVTCVDGVISVSVEKTFGAVEVVTAVELDVTTDIIHYYGPGDD